MVDFRPLLFANALALMLLVTAGFAAIRDDLNQNQPREIAAEPEPTPQSATPAKPLPVIASQAPKSAPEQAQMVVPPPAKVAKALEPSSEQPTAPRSERFTLPAQPERSPQLARAEPVLTPAPRAKAPPPPKPAPTTGALTVRSNVVGDSVSINGKEYGATRLDLTLAPGTYEVVISKPGFKPWRQTVALDAGEEMTLVGRLEAYTTVNYRNGTWVGGVKTGDGTYEDSDGLRYKGHFINGRFHGQGTAWYPDGSRYDGDWVDGQREGEGVWRGADGSEYTGQFAADKFQGKGTLTLANGDILTGQWLEGLLNGHGSLTTADGMLYVGGFRNNEFHGKGVLTHPDGRSYEGEFSNGEYHGSGIEIFANGKRYEGQYIEGKFHGKGLLRNPNGSSIEATFRHGEPYGQVRLTTAAGEVFTARTTEPGVCYREKSYRATQCPKLEGW